ncbi:PrpR N-terminal domain-containing protein [Alkaliphilus pronyensis]|nr:PrpR N-terminal domain-containing protein [Alkaliphilus pronyensis]
MIKIAVIVPKDLVETTKLAAEEFQEHIVVEEGSMKIGLDLAKKYESLDFDVLIARSGTKLLFKSAGIQIPSISIPLTVRDIYDSLKDAEECDSKITIIAFQNMLSVCRDFTDITERSINIIEVDNEKEVEEKIIDLKKSSSNRVIIGGGIIARYGPKYGFKTIVFKTGKSSIIKAIKEGIKVAKATKEEKKRGARFKGIVENSRDGIFSFDKNGLINTFNSSAEKLLKAKGEDIVGKHIDDAFPQFELMEVLDSGVGEVEVVKSINDKKMMVSKIPIKVNNEVTDGVVMLHDINRIQQMEEKIRRDALSSGFSANYTFEDMVSYSQKSKEVIEIAKEYAKVDSTI